MTHLATTTRAGWLGPRDATNLQTIADGGGPATKSGTETLTNKTLTTPIITLEQGSSVAPTAEGRIAWDTDDNKLKVGDGAGTKTFSDDSLQTVYVASRTALKALDVAINTAALLGESGREGAFKWDSSDLSSKIAPASVTSTAVDSSTEVITKAGHGLYTGQAVIATTSVNGLNADTLYYVISVTSSTFKLASSRANALAGTAFNLTGTTNFTVKVILDDLEGIYVVPTVKARDGSGGAWVRIYDRHNVNIAWWAPDTTGSTSASTTIQVALDALNVSSLGAKVNFGPGVYLLTTMLTVYGHISLAGAGFGSTEFRRTADYGNTISFGIASFGPQNSTISGIWFNHQRTYTAGDTTLANAVTGTPAHIYMWHGQHTNIEDCWFDNLAYGIVVDGGANIYIRRCRISGLYDPVYSGTQEGLAGIKIIQGTADSSIPTFVYLQNLTLGGNSSANRPKYYNIGTQLAENSTGFNSRGAWATSTSYALKDVVTSNGRSWVCSTAHTSDAAKQPYTGANFPTYWQVYQHSNIGWREPIYIECTEHTTITESYIGAGGANLIRFVPSYVCSDIVIANNYFDGCEGNAIFFDNGSTFAIDVFIHHNAFFGTGATKHHIFSGFSGSTPTVTGLTVSGNHFRDSVMDAIKLFGAEGGTIADNVIWGYNYHNLDTGSNSADHSIGVYLIGPASGSGLTRKLSIADNVFGGVGSLFSTTAPNTCNWGINTASIGTTSDIRISDNSGTLRTALLVGDITAQASPTFPAMAAGDLLYASGTDALSKIAAVAAGSVLLSAGAGAAPAWSAAPVAWTPTITQGAGGAPTIAPTFDKHAHFKIGAIHVFMGRLNMSSNVGTASGNVILGLPSTAKSGFVSAAWGSEAALTNKAIKGFINDNDTSVKLCYYDASTMWVANQVFYVVGFYLDY